MKTKEFFNRIISAISKLRLLSVSGKPCKKNKPWFKLNIKNTYMYSFITSIVVCQLLTNNWFISIVSSVIVTVVFMFITYLVTVYISNKKFIKVFINERDIEMSKSEDGINVNLYLALDERKKVETTVKKITPRLKILYKDSLKYTIEPEFELIAPRLNSNISFSEDTVIIINLSLNNFDTQKIGLTWYRIICYIDILTSKNKTKTLYVDLSDQILNFMVKEIYTNNEQTQNLNPFINSIKNKNINDRINNFTDEEKESINRKTQENNAFMAFMNEEKYNEIEDDNNNYIDLDDPIAVEKADKEIREEQKIR